MIDLPQYIQLPSDDPKANKGTSATPKPLLPTTIPSDDPPAWEECPPQVDFRAFASQPRQTVNPYQASTTLPNHPLPPLHYTPVQTLYDYNEAQALERAMQSLEFAASLQSNVKIQKSLRDSAHQLRNLESESTDHWLPNGNPDAGVIRNIGGGIILLCTTPIYLAGAVIEGTGYILHTTGVLIRGLGRGMKKVHMFTVEKLKL